MNSSLACHPALKCSPGGRQQPLVGWAETDLRSKKMSTILKAILVALSAAFALSACNTVRGAGQDVEKAGEKVQQGADKKQRY